MTFLRPDQQIICEWIKPGSRVLDLGCGDGALLAHLQKTLEVTGYGIEIRPDQVFNSIKAGVNVIQVDINTGLSVFDDHSFDFVIVSQALQALKRPDLVVDEILRIGKQGIVTFPNFAYWKNRIQIGLQGVMPVSGSLPNPWYNTHNIHLCTLRDFEALCAEKEIEIISRAVVDHQHRESLPMRVLPNLFGEVALYRFERKN